MVTNVTMQKLVVLEAGFVDLAILLV